ncbi:MAG: Uma2 family endonuclease [Micromonosporaceae bacterium]
MTKEPVTEPARETPMLRPTGEAWTIEDLLQLPDDGNRYEIAHGSLLVTPPPALKHFRSTHRLCEILQRQAPPEIMVSGVGVGVDFRDVPGGKSFYIPDVLAIPEAAVERDGLAFDPSEVLLVVEVHSPSNAANDRVLKRHDYGAVGIPWYWMVDPAERLLTVLKHNGKHGYDAVAAIKAGDTWETDDPFPLTLDPADFT